MQLVLVATVPLFLYLFQRFVIGKRNLPPGPTLWQLWSKRFLFAEKPHVALKELAEIYGPIMSLRLGSQLVVVASSTDIAKEIYKTNNQIFSGRHFPSIYYNIPGAIGSSILISKECDERWKFLRSIAQNFIFSSKAVESFAGLRKTKVKEMVEFLKTKKMVNIERVMHVSFLNIFTNILVSGNLCETGGESKKDEKKICLINDLIKKASIPGLTDMFPILKGIDFWTKKKGMEMYRDVKLIWGDVIEERRASREAKPDSKQDFMDVLNGYSFNEDQIRVTITEILTAATDSSLVVAVWFMAEVIKNQEILYKLRQEIAENGVEGDELNESLLSGCVYLHACIKETLRLHSPGPFGVPHRATKTCKVSNYTIPKDTMVIVNSWLIQKDNNVYEDARTFNPRRFLDSKIDFRGAHFELLPFGAGTRSCPGILVAIKSLQLMVASLVHYFDWSLPDGKDPTELDMSENVWNITKDEKAFLFDPKPKERLMLFEI